MTVSVVASENEKPSRIDGQTDGAQSTTSPPEFVATRLADAIRLSRRSLCYVAQSEEQLSELAEALGALFPDIELLVLPPWDCLPYDRVKPSRHCMGRRMDALRIWLTSKIGPQLLLTSLEATLQRVPPTGIIVENRVELVVGAPFQRKSFLEFVQKTGYLEEGVADDPGEVAMREGVIDIYPAGAPGPLRIVLSDDDRVEELRGFDRRSQRTESYLDRVTFGPASEIISPECKPGDLVSKTDTMERLLLRQYDEMPTVFDILGDTSTHLAPGVTEGIGRYLEIIEDARFAREGSKIGGASRSIYLTRDEWETQVGEDSKTGLGRAATALPIGASGVDNRDATLKLLRDRLANGFRVVVSGTGKKAEALCRRTAKIADTSPVTVDTWEAVRKAKPGTLLKLQRDLKHGFIDAVAEIALYAVPDGPRTSADLGFSLSEPELRIGDVVVHEEHGVGILADLENVVVEGISRDAARLTYRDGGSVLVPMDEFAKLWRYGSEPDAVTLDRLHTEAWQKKREKIAADIQSTARHLLKTARRRQKSEAERFVPPRAALSAFIRRFPFTETTDQSEAISAVFSDLASGKVMNRLICGDVGFGKTEIALRAAAAVALCGGQVVVVAPTTVLARQHFSTFESRFAGTGVKVGMLSRLLKQSEIRQVKEALATGEMGIVIATQAVLAKNVHFARLSLLIVDEEHRFGLKEKRAMSALAPSLHTLTMSATPIPRTLLSAMIGVQEASILNTPPSKRRPVRTAIAQFDEASLRTGLMREHRRDGQSFIVVPRIEDIGNVEKVLQKLVPELTVKVAHGRMPAGTIDETIVGFAEGGQDILLATNIIENGLDIPRANSIFVLNADRFGLAQLHQLRGRVGRASAQGVAYLLTEKGAELAEETRLRLETLAEIDRLGAGFSISLRDLDLRGGGDIAGEDQAGHMKILGIGFYQKLLAGAVAKLRKQPSSLFERTVVNIGATGKIPPNYVPDAAIRLNLYAKQMRATCASEIDDLEEEFDDRFGELPQDVALLLRITRLQLAAGRLHIARIEGGPKGLAITLTPRTPAKLVAALLKQSGAFRREERVIFDVAGNACQEDLLSFAENLLFTRRSLIG